MRKMAFIIPPEVELLDLAGPVQVFTEAKIYGFETDLEFYQFQETPVSTSGLGFGKISNYKDAKLKEGDFVFVPGMNFEYVNSISFKAERAFFNWLKECSDKDITVCSICNGAFALGHAGLLKNTECTTHWRRVNELQLQFPEAKVVSDILYIKSNNVYMLGGKGLRQFFRHVYNPGSEFNQACFKFNCFHFYQFWFVNLQSKIPSKILNHVILNQNPHPAHPSLSKLR